MNAASADDPRRERARLAVAIVLLVPVGLATKWVPGEAGWWVRDYLGGVLYVTFFTLLCGALRPDWPRTHVVLGVLAATCAVECLQLWHPPWLQAIRATFVGRTLLGDTFAWGDFPHYAVGSLLGWVGLRAAARQQPDATSAG